MADVTFTIAIKDDGTPVIRQIKKEAAEMGNDIDTAARRANSGLGTMTQGLGTMRGSVSALLPALAAVSVGVLGISSAAQLVGGAVIGMNSTLEKAEIQFTNLLGSADAARQHVADLFQFAAKTPFETGPIIEASRALLTFGGRALATQENLQIVGDAAAGASQGIQEVAIWFGRAANAIQSGRPFGEAAQRLQEMGILTGDTRTKLEALSASGADTAQVWQLLLGDFRRFQGQMEAQAGTWEGLTSTISDNVNLVLAEAFKPYFDDLKEMLRLTAEFTQSDNFRNWAQATKEAFDTVFAAIATVVSAVRFLNAALGTVKAGGEAVASGIDQGAQAFSRFDKALAEFLRLSPDMEQRAREVAQLFAGAEAASPKQLIEGFRALTGEIKKAGSAAVQSGQELGGYTTKEIEARAEAQKLVEAARKQVEAFGKSAAELLKAKAVQLQANAATKEQGDALAKLAAQLDAKTKALEAGKKAEKEHTKDVRDAAKAEKDRLKDLSDAKDLILKNAAELEEIRRKEARDLATSTAAVKAQIAAYKNEAQVFGQVASGARGYDDAIRELAIAHKLAEPEIQKLGDAALAQATALVDAERAARIAREGVADLAKEAKGVKFNLGDALADDMEQVVSGILLGTRKAGDAFDALADIGVSAFARMFAETIRRKLSWETTLSGNLLNDIPALFTQSGTLSQGGFLSGLSIFRQGGLLGGLGGSGGLFGQTLPPGVFGPPAPGFFQQGSGLFGGSGFGGFAGLAGIGAGLFGGGPPIARGISGGLGAAALIPGPQQPFVGAAALLASIFGGFDLFGGPGRIELEKNDIEDFLQDVLGIPIPLKKTQDFLPGGEANFGNFRGSLSALGALFARGKEGPAVGTIKRFGNLALAGFEQNDLTQDEAQAAVLKIADAMGFTLKGAIDEVNAAMKAGEISLKRYNEEVKDGEPNIVKLGDVLKGVVDIATGFNKDIDTAAIVNDSLAKKFQEVAGGAGALGGQVGTLAEQIKGGTLSFEDAVNQLNAMRVAAGETALELADFSLDPAALEKELGIIQAAIIEAGQAGADLAGMLSQSIAQGLSDSDIADNIDAYFTNVFGQHILGSVIQKAVEGLQIEKLLAPIFKSILEAQDKFASGELDQAGFSARIKDILADAGPDLDKLKAGLLAAGQAGRALLEELGLLPDSLKKSTDEADDLVAKIRELEQQILAIAQRRIEIRLQLIDDLASIGLGNTLDATNARIAALRDQIFSIAGSGSIPTSPFVDLSDQDLATVIQLQEQLRQLILSRYQQEAAAIQARAQEAIAVIQAEYAARREAINLTIQGLQQQRQDTQRLFQEQIEGLQKQLAVAQEFARVADSLDSIIRQATLSPQSGLSRGQQLGGLQRDAAAIRQQLLTATGSDRARLIQELAGILQQQIQFVDQNSVEGQALFSKIIAELSSLRDETRKEGDKAAKLQEQIASATAQMEAALRNIDAQIAQQQQLLASLSAQEQAAIKAVQDTAQRELTELRERTAQELRDLATQQDLALKEEQRRREREAEAARGQLIALVGTEEATRLLAAGDKAQVLQLAKANLTLLSLDKHIGDLVNKIEPAADGYHGQGRGNHLFLTHPNERIDITPRGQAPTSGSSSISFQFAPVVQVQVEPGAEGRVKQDVEDVLRMAEQRFLRKLETDWAPRIRRVAEGKI